MISFLQMSKGLKSDVHSVGEAMSSCSDAWAGDSNKMFQNTLHGVHDKPNDMLLGHREGLGSYNICIFLSSYLHGV